MRNWELGGEEVAGLFFETLKKGCSGSFCVVSVFLLLAPATHARIVRAGRGPSHLLPVPPTTLGFAKTLQRHIYRYTLLCRNN